MGFRESASTLITASPDAAFGLVTDPSRLPLWNHAITQLIDDPGSLEVGSVWKVRMQALGQSWVSRSQVSKIDSATGQFAYRSWTDDGNPSYADWDWQVEQNGAGSRVTVGVDLNPATFWRKHLLVHLRRPALRAEILGSLRALGCALDS